MQPSPSASNASLLSSVIVAIMLLFVAGCTSMPPASKSTTAPITAPANSGKSSPPAAGRSVPAPAAGSGRGGYYQDDGPGDNPPTNLLAVPDAEPKIEPVLPSTNRPYVVFGKTYTPLAANQPLKQRGVGSWYGKKFHGQKTASGERYDMYKMTAAHPTMPLPSYARVTNLSNGKQVIVRVNDRGPFHSSRIIDLSYTAAMKLGYVSKGSSELEVERLLPDEIARLEKSRLGERAIALSPSTASDVASSASPVSVITTQPISRNETLTPVVQPTPPNPTLDIGTPSTETVLVADAMPSPTTTALSTTGGFYLQIGAFSQMPNAEAARARFSRDTANSLPPLEVAQTGSVFKLLSGPFQTRSDAALAAQKLMDVDGTKAFIVQR